MMVQSALNGERVTMFAYGNTGSGKTFTMEGCAADEKEDLRGIIPRSVQQVFQSVKEMSKFGWKYQLWISCVEVYNEKVFELLGCRKELTLVHGKQFNSLKDVNFPEITEYQQVESLLIEAKGRRQKAETGRNVESSRSHFIFQMRVKGVHENGEVCRGVLTLVDLAGSENAGAAKGGSRQVVEAANIKTSLLTLNRALMELKNPAKSANMSFRGSKLTEVLEDNLKKGTRTLMMLNISPGASVLNESLNSLSFGSEVCKAHTKKVDFDQLLKGLDL
jgi:kinesin family protein C1